MAKRTALERIRLLVKPQRRIAEALGMSQEQLSRISTGKSPEPTYLEVIAEFLEVVPPKDWPHRWK